MQIKFMFFKLSKIVLLSALIFVFFSFCTLVAVVTFLPHSVSATDAGPNLPSTVVDDASLGTSAWASAGNVTASDNAYASATLTPLEVSHYLKATNFGFSIPGGATINGILVEWEVLGTTGINTKDNTARIVKAGVIGTTDRANATSWTSSDTFLPHGSSSDLWGTTWTPADIRLVAEDKHLTFMTAIEEKECMVNADGVKLKQVFLNLIDNSIKYTKEGFIKVSLVKDENEKVITFAVADSGVGLSEETKKKLFTKFGRGEGGALNSGGSGLGLYLAQEIVKAHQGEIKATSDGTDKGTVFSVILPYTK
jgi:hypothetical protein